MSMIIYDSGKKSKTNSSKSKSNSSNSKSSSPVYTEITKIAPPRLMTKACEVIDFKDVCEKRKDCEFDDQTAHCITKPPPRPSPYINRLTKPPRGGSSKRRRMTKAKRTRKHTKRHRRRKN